jgi:predicted amidohydrolase
MSSKCQASADPADVFMKLFDDIAEDLFLGSAADQLFHRSDVVAAAREIEKTIRATGRAAAELAELPDDDTRDAAAIARLSALDRVFRAVHPNAQAPVPPKLSYLSSRHTRLGRFNKSDEAGLLLPRLMEYGAPRHRADKHERFSVVRVSRQRMQKISFISFGSRGWPTVTCGEDLVVACVPFLDKGEDVTLDRIDEFSQAWYRLAPVDDSRLEQRVSDALAALDASGATVGLLPEEALSGSLLDIWKGQLASTYAKAHSPLAFIVAGTGPVSEGGDPPVNRAVVLDRKGQELWSQDKICDYTLDQATVKLWNLPGLGSGDLLEYITRGNQLVVAETTFGRIAILICEDLGRCDSRDVVPRHLGVSHLLVPVFDAPLGAHRWERFAAENYLKWIGSRVVVSNSRVVGHLQGGSGAMATAFGISPSAGSGSYTFNASQVLSTSSPAEAATVKLAALGPVP